MTNVMPSRLPNRRRRRNSLAISLVAAGLTCFLPLPAFAGTSVAASTTALTATTYASCVSEAARRFGIPEGWIWSLMRVESGGHSHAVSPKGAIGLMQLMPATWSAMTARYGLGSDPFDIRANIHAGAAFLREMWDRYGNVAAMLAAYNAGPRRADAYVMGYAGLPSETTAYVERIAPQISGDGRRTGSSVTPRRPANWRQAMLFTSQPNVTTERVDTASSERRSRTSDAHSAAPFSAYPAPKNVLFIAVSGGGAP